MPSSSPGFPMRASSWAYPPLSGKSSALLAASLHRPKTCAIPFARQVRPRCRSSSCFPAPVRRT
eukprot:14254628-Alexandrium_andersonii.AAC.1